MMAFCLMCGSSAQMKVPKGDDKPRLVCPSCGYIHYVNPKIICGSVVTWQDKVLLCRRAIEPQYGLWTLPAGFMECGETLAQGAARETCEEAEAKVTNEHLYCIYDIPNIAQVYMIYLAELVEGKFGAGAESLECALFAEDDIPWDTLAFPSMTLTLTHYFNDKKSGHFPLRIETIHREY